MSETPAEMTQAEPKPTTGRPVWELVVEDMKVRDQVGRQKYGVPLQAGNGRDALVDAYQESLDQCVYLRQAIEEREMVRVLVRELIASHWNAQIQAIADSLGVKWP